VIGTTALLSGFSLLGLPGAALLDHGRAVALGWANLLLAAAGLVLALVLMWGESDSEGAWKTLLVIVAFAGAAAQASGTTARLRPDDPSPVTALYLAGLGGAFLLALLVVIAVWQEVEDEGYYRFVGALAVADVLVVILQPILRRTAGRPRPAPVADTGNTFSFTCTLDDGREVRREQEAADFGAAVATAIGELERSGGRVMKIERAEA
jgi:peptidoglycan/LPS O-acetylase OafA/YrhL